MLAQGEGGRRLKRVSVAATTGRCRRATPLQAGEPATDLDFRATLQQAALRLAETGSRPAQPPAIRHADLRKKRRFRPRSSLIVLLVDASDSMSEGTVARMRACKGAALAILRQAYLNRSKVALVAFSGEHASLVLPPTHSVARARQKLERLPTGGATPFADGLFKAWQLIRQERIKDPGMHALLVVVSDGEANVPMIEGHSTLRELLGLALRLKRESLACVLIDVGPELGRGVPMARLAAHLGATHVRVADLTSRHILRVVKNALPSGLPDLRQS